MTFPQRLRRSWLFRRWIGFEETIWTRKVADEEVRKLVGGNLLDAYPRFDETVLHDVTARVGMSVDEVSTAPDLGKHEFIRDTGSLGFRIHGPWS